MRHGCLVFVAALIATGCPGDDGEPSGSDTSSTGGGDELMTTLPITATLGEDTGPTPGSATGSATGGSSSGAMATGSTGSNDTTGNGTTAGDSSSGGSSAWDVEWCRLQAPAMVTESVGTPFTVYGRLYAEGLTDTSRMTDPDAMLVAEAGWGADGSDPAVDMWTWVAATPNIAFNGNDWGEPDNDEYNADLVIDRAGSFDFAYRFSGDGGTTWVYCDLDDLLTGGYTPEQAGDATIQ